MKTQFNHLKRIGLASTLALGFATVAWLTPAASAADTGSAKGGAAQLTRAEPLPGKPIQSAADLAAVEPGDLVVSACPKCKNVMVTRVTAERGQLRQTSQVQHLCPGCGAKIEAVGHGKAKQEKVTHVCGHCGAKSAFCCVVKSPAAMTHEGGHH